MILAGDVGGTKTHLALFDPGASPRRPRLDRKFASRDHPSLEALVMEFLSSAAGDPPTRAVIGIAGPVVDNRCEATNLPWVMDGEVLGRHLGGTRVTLLNDLEATAWGLGVLDASDFETLQEGFPADGNRALIAAGTGLGEAVIARIGSDWRPLASEGGHADFGPRDPLEDDLARWIRDQYGGHASYERVLSGPGLADLYRFLGATGRGEETPAVRERLASAADPAVVVSETAIEGSSERSILAVRKFVEIYGAEAGNLALKALAVGGVYVGGGIAPKLISFLRDGRFVAAFRAKGRLMPLLERIPIRVILDQKTALWGAAAYALA